jgi:hypothetical protein
MPIMNLRTISLLILIVATLFPVAYAQEMKMEYHGAGWTQFGKVEESYGGAADPQNDNDNNWMQNAGAQISATAKVDANWEASLALGVVGVHGARGQREVANFWYPFWVPYVGEARITYTDSVFNVGRLQLTMGNFGYGYGSNNKNLGLYLMRGYVYPGALESGFGSVFGALARYEQGKFRNDLIVKSEEQRPAYDLSLIDVVAYQVHPGLELGAGVNFYRLIPRDADLTTPDSVCTGSYGQCSILDPSDSTLVTGSLAGIKAMVRFSADPKLLFGFSSLGALTLGKQDLVLYGEAAIIGVKDYDVVYDDITERIPVMVGLNLPAFGHLDVFSVEAEYYGSKNSSDNFHANFGGAWVPRQDDDDVYDRDDWKWSVNVAKTLVSNLQLSAQVANDHLRLGGWHNAPNTGKEAMRTPKDWYWTCKLAYFF